MRTPPFTIDTSWRTAPLIMDSASDFDTLSCG
jgi:hypothetical protein